MKNWESIFESKISEIATTDDPAHDLLHFKRVVKTARRLCEIEGGKIEVVLPAAWLHDFVIIPKNDPRREIASRLSAEAAIIYLHSVGYADESGVPIQLQNVLYQNIAHAIEAHSFSANITAKSLEAKIVQDADRLDGIGAIGVARCFATAGIMKSSFYSDEDPFCATREPNDKVFTVDHFYRKLFKTAASLQTSAGREEGLKRVERMKQYLSDLAAEI